MVDDLRAVDNADGEARKVVVVGRHGARVFGGLAADERAAGLHAALGHAGNERRDLLRLVLADGDVVEEEDGLCTAADDVVDAHGNAVDADGVVLVHQLRDALLRAHAVRARNEHGLAHTGEIGRKQAAKAADIGHNAWDHGALDVLFHQLDALVAGLDIHAGVTVALGKTTHFSFSPLH